MPLQRALKLQQDGFMTTVSHAVWLQHGLYLLHTGFAALSIAPHVFTCCMAYYILHILQIYNCPVSY